MNPTVVTGLEVLDIVPMTGEPDVSGDCSLVLAAVCDTCVSTLDDSQERLEFATVVVVVDTDSVVGTVTAFVVVVSKLSNVWLVFAAIFSVVWAPVVNAVLPLVC